MEIGNIRETGEEVPSYGYCLNRYLRTKYDWELNFTFLQVDGYSLPEIE